MPTVALAGWGYNGGQVIFKFQADRDSRINPTVYEQVAENCECCCLPPPRVKISLYPGTILTSLVAGAEFSPEQNAQYNQALQQKVEEKLTLTLDNVICPDRSKWDYYATFTVPGSPEPCTVYLEVPRCARYPQDFKCGCLNGDNTGIAPDMRLPIDGMPLGPTPYIEQFNFRGFDDSNGSSGFPTIGLCIENICKLYGINQRTFRIPCYRYSEIGPTGLLTNGIRIPTTPVTYWQFWAQDDGFEGKLAYFDIEFPGDPLP
jgi:hypothetical protein